MSAAAAVCKLPVNRVGKVLKSKVLVCESLLPHTHLTETDDELSVELPPKRAACICIDLQNKARM